MSGNLTTCRWGLAFAVHYRLAGLIEKIFGKSWQIKRSGEEVNITKDHEQDEDMNDSVVLLDMTTDLNVRPFCDDVWSSDEDDREWDGSMDVDGTEDEFGRNNCAVDGDKDGGKYKSRNDSEKDDTSGGEIPKFKNEPDVLILVVGIGALILSTMLSKAHIPPHLQSFANTMPIQISQSLPLVTGITQISSFSCPYTRRHGRQYH